MKDSPYFRDIHFEGILNFRDLGGYRTKSGHQVTWRRIFRSGELRCMTEKDLERLRFDVRLTSVIDLRDQPELKRDGLGLLPGAGCRYYNVPFTTSQADRDAVFEVFRRSSNMGEIYLFFLSHGDYAQRVVEALHIIAESQNHPLAFHCSAGKDRTGVLSAMVLDILGASDQDIIADYALTGSAMPAHIRRLLNRPETAAMLNSLPRYADEANPASMALFLSAIRGKYGSLRGYLETHGADRSLFGRLEEALLE